MCGRPAVKAEERHIQTPKLLFLTYISLILVSFVLMSLSICILQDQTAATQEVFTPLLLGD